MSIVINDLHKRALAYIRNASGDMFGKVEIAWFDDDHEPIGPSLRGDLMRALLIEEMVDDEGHKCIKMTNRGREELKNA